MVNKIQTTNEKIRELTRFTQFGLCSQREYQSLCLDLLHPKINTSTTLPYWSISNEHSIPEITYSY